MYLPKGDGFVFLLGQGRATPLFRSALNSSTIDPYLPSARKVSFAQHPLTGTYHIFYNGIADDRSDLLVAPVDPSTGNPCSNPAELVRGIVFCLS